MYRCEDISDHDKALREMKKTLGINAVGTKRNLFKMTEEIIERCGEWYKARNAKCYAT